MSDQIPRIEVSFRERRAADLVAGVAGELDYGSVGAFLEAMSALGTDEDRHMSSICRIAPSVTLPASER